MSWKIASHQPLQNVDVAIAARGNVIAKYQQSAINVQDLCAMITLKYTVNSATRVIRIVPKNTILPMISVYLSTKLLLTDIFLVYFVFVLLVSNSYYYL